jgi:hypothetical protein
MNRRTAWKVAELDEQAATFVKIRAIAGKAPQHWIDAVEKQSLSIQKKFWALVELKEVM